MMNPAGVGLGKADEHSIRRIRRDLAHRYSCVPVRPDNPNHLPRYFSEGILTTAGVVLVDHVPSPPLSAFGLTEFKNFETQEMAGITFADTYFLLANYAHTESLHFHELVHVVQWKVLGPENFLLVYAEGLARHGYAQSPLEQMAFRHQALFEGGQPGYAVETEVLEETSILVKGSVHPRGDGGGR